MTELGDKQREFPLMLAALITWAYEHQGYELTLGEAYRTPEQAALNAKSGKGISNSLHTKRLAIDLNLFINGVYQTDSEAYRPLGDKWKSLNKLARWGGDFTKTLPGQGTVSAPDGNHFSIEHEGVK